MKVLENDSKALSPTEAPILSRLLPPPLAGVFKPASGNPSPPPHPPSVTMEDIANLTFLCGKHLNGDKGGFPLFQLEGESPRTHAQKEHGDMWKLAPWGGGTVFHSEKNPYVEKAQPLYQDSTH